MIDLIIVEDDKNLSDSLLLILETFEEARVLAVAPTVAEAVKAIDKLKPTLVFMDIMLTDGTGFDVLNQIKYNQFKVVFTTSYAEYAIRAFELSALHYLLKPLSFEMIDEVFKRFDSYNDSTQFSNMLKIAENSFKNKVDRIMLYTNSGNEVFMLNDIIRIEAEQNYSNVIFANCANLLISKNIKYFESLLEEFGFCRVHHSYIVNIDHIKKFNKGRFQSIVMMDGFEIRIADAKKQILQEKLSEKVLNS